LTDFYVRPTGVELIIEDRRKNFKRCFQESLRRDLQDPVPDHRGKKNSRFQVKSGVLELPASSTAIQYSKDIKFRRIKTAFFQSKVRKECGHKVPGHHQQLAFQV